jgi:hypothetical protein
MNNNIFNISSKVQRIHETLTRFVQEECIPAEAVYDAQLKLTENRWKVCQCLITVYPANNRRFKGKS